MLCVDVNGIIILGVGRLGDVGLVWEGFLGEVVFKLGRKWVEFGECKMCWSWVGLGDFFFFFDFSRCVINVRRVLGFVLGVE